MFIICQSIGLPPISPIGLGLTVVSSDNRVPSPPARMATFIFTAPIFCHFRGKEATRQDAYPSWYEIEIQPPNEGWKRWRPNLTGKRGGIDYFLPIYG